MGGKRAAVLVGCNYKGTLAELKGCVNDVWAMHATLCKRFLFNEADIQVLVDNDPTLTMPTGANIRQALRTAIASTLGPGDAIFFHFSGHGTRLPPSNVSLSAKLTPLQYDECIVPCDMNLLTDEDIHEVAESLPQGVTFTIVADSCHSGGLIRYEKEQIGDSFTCLAAPSTKENAYVDREAIMKSMKDEVVLVDNDKITKSIGIESSRSMPVTTLMEILKGNDEERNTSISNIRQSLVTMFKEESSIKFRNSHTTLKPSLTCSNMYDKDNKVESKSCCQRAINKSSTFLHEACDVTVGRVLCENTAILISACQAYETAQDFMPSCASSKNKLDANTRSSFGALSYAILSVMSQIELNSKVTNYDLVMHARKVLVEHGITQQHPGLYCCDAYVNAPFIANQDVALCFHKQHKDVDVMDCRPNLY